MADNKDTFFDVIYEYRYLALAGCGWLLYGPAGEAQKQKAANELLPGIGVILQDSLLAHARSLIEFYTNSNPSSTDTALLQFDHLAICSSLKGSLRRYQRPISVHALHLTTWRDPVQRAAGPLDVARPDWNTEASPLVQLLLNALENAAAAAAAAPSKWARPFSDLHAAASDLFADREFQWPHYLTEKQDVTAYLAAQGIR